MKLSIERDHLADTVAWTARAIPARPSIPVITGLHLDAEDGLTVSAFDYDTSRRCTASADVAEPGKVVIPGRVLAEIVKNLPRGFVDLAIEGTEAVIRCGRAEFALPTLPLDDYPTLPALPEATGVVDATALATAIGQTVVATSNDDNLPMLTGIRADITTDTITLAATDRYRIATTTIPWKPGNLTADTGLMFPGRQLHDMVKGLTGSATLHLADGISAITAQDRTTTIRLLEDQFIDYRSRTSTDGYSTWAETDVTPLVEAVKRVALVAARNTAVRLDFRPGDVVVQAGSGDVGRGSELVDGVELDGDPLQIAFQPHYLLHGLEGVPGDRVRIGMTTPNKPALITAADSDEPYRYLVMSLRLSS